MKYFMTDQVYRHPDWLHGVLPNSELYDPKYPQKLRDAKSHLGRQWRGRASCTHKYTNSKNEKTLRNAHQMESPFGRFHRGVRRMSEYDHHDPLQLISLLDMRDARIAELEKALLDAANQASLYSVDDFELLNANNKHVVRICRKALESGG